MIQISPFFFPPHALLFRLLHFLFSFLSLGRFSSFLVSQRLRPFWDSLIKRRTLKSSSCYSRESQRDRKNKRRERKNPIRMLGRLGSLKDNLSDDSIKFLFDGNSQLFLFVYLFYVLLRVAVMMSGCLFCLEKEKEQDFNVVFQRVPSNLVITAVRNMRADRRVDGGKKPNLLSDTNDD